MNCGLPARGIAKGERVGIWAPNCPEWTILPYATAKIGASLVNINPSIGSPEWDGLSHHNILDDGDFVAGRLAHYKVPRYVKVVDAFPMTVTGKVRRVEMREVSARELGLTMTDSA